MTNLPDLPAVHLDRVAACLDPALAADRVLAACLVVHPGRVVVCPVRAPDHRAAVAHPVPAVAPVPVVAVYPAAGLDRAVDCPVRAPDHQVAVAHPVPAVCPAVAPVLVEAVYPAADLDRVVDCPVRAPDRRVAVAHPVPAVCRVVVRALVGDHQAGEAVLVVGLDRAVAYPARALVRRVAVVRPVLGVGLGPAAACRVRALVHRDGQAEASLPRVPVVRALVHRDGQAEASLPRVPVVRVLVHPVDPAPVCLAEFGHRGVAHPPDRAVRVPARRPPLRPVPVHPVGVRPPVRDLLVNLAVACRAVCGRRVVHPPVRGDALQGRPADRRGHVARLNQPLRAMNC